MKLVSLEFRWLMSLWFLQSHKLLIWALHRILYLLLTLLVRDWKIYLIGCWINPFGCHLICVVALDSIMHCSFHRRRFHLQKIVEIALHQTNSYCLATDCCFHIFAAQIQTWQVYAPFDLHYGFFGEYPSHNVTQFLVFSPNLDFLVSSVTQ